MLKDMLAQTVARVKKDVVFHFGDKHDGVIEFVGLVSGGLVEVGYFYGDNKPKNIITVSSQVGCPCGCSFCDLGEPGNFKRNLSPEEIYEQAILMLQVARQYSIDIEAIDHKISVAKTGEPLLNPNLLSGIKKLAVLGFSFKFSTVFPRGAEKRLLAVSDFCAGYNKPVQLQISLISTNDEFRKKMVRAKLADFDEISAAGKIWKSQDPFDRKINLSLIITRETVFDYGAAQKYFPPDTFRFRLRPYVENEHGKANRLMTISEKGYREAKEKLRQLGYDVGDWAVPTPIEKRFGLTSNVTRRRYQKIISGEI